MMSATSKMEKVMMAIINQGLAVVAFAADTVQLLGPLHIRQVELIVEQLTHCQVLLT